MCCAVKKAYFDKYYFEIYENVYEPAEDSFLFAENIEVKYGAQVLDMGAGCGILGILSAEKASSVLTIDINPYAISCAKVNSILNNVSDKMVFLQADLFTALNRKATFDLILFNAPYLPTAESDSDSWIGRSWAGGVNGRQVIDRFISQLPLHLNRFGRVLLMQSTLTGVEETVNNFVMQNLNVSIKARLFLPFFETLTLIEAKA
jgi:release factor glutamine methyltransferase